MSKTFELCGKDIHSLIAKVMKEHHESLHKLGVTVQAVFASACDKTHSACPALFRHGLAAAAKIQVTPLADRARGIADAKLTICSFSWERLNEASRVALIDHELHHLQPAPSKKSGLRDDLRRPKLKLRPHDYELFGFLPIVKRHGESALEVRAMRTFLAEQLPLFPAGIANQAKML